MRLEEGNLLSPYGAETEELAQQRDNGDHREKLQPGHNDLSDAEAGGAAGAAAEHQQVDGSHGEIHAEHFVNGRQNRVQHELCSGGEQRRREDRCGDDRALRENTAQQRHHERSEQHHGEYRDTHGSGALKRSGRAQRGARAEKQHPHRVNGHFLLIHCQVLRSLSEWQRRRKRRA